MGPLSTFSSFSRTHTLFVVALTFSPFSPLVTSLVSCVHRHTHTQHKRSTTIVCVSIAVNNSPHFFSLSFFHQPHPPSPPNSKLPALSKPLKPVADVNPHPMLLWRNKDHLPANLVVHCTHETHLPAHTHNHTTACLRRKTKGKTKGEKKKKKGNNPRNGLCVTFAVAHTSQDHHHHPPPPSAIAIMMCVFTTRCFTTLRAGGGWRGGVSSRTCQKTSLTSFSLESKAPCCLFFFCVVKKNEGAKKKRQVSCTLVT